MVTLRVRSKFCALHFGGFLCILSKGEDEKQMLKISVDGLVRSDFQGCFPASLRKRSFNIHNAQYCNLPNASTVTAQLLSLAERSEHSLTQTFNQTNIQTINQ